MKRCFVYVAVALLCAASVVYGSAQSESAGAATGVTKILWWSHWANEPSKVKVIEKIADEYMAAHSNVQIEITWYDKNPLRDAFRAAMTAGSKEVADIVTLDDDQIPSLADAGWITSLDALPKDRFVSGAVEGGSYKGSLYKFNIGKSLNMILYNREIMKQIGVAVPSSNQFSSADYLDTVKKASSAGYAGAADAIGNRPDTAARIPYNLTATMYNSEDWSAVWTGKRSFDTPEMHEALNYMAQLGDAGFWPPTFTTMTIDEYHVYFHTQRKALYLWIPSWYTGRSFKPEDQGGQSPDFHFGMLLNPKLPGAKYPGNIGVNFESGYGVSTAHPENRDVAIDILRFMTQPRYAVLWEAYTQIPAAVKYTASDKPSDLPASPWGWYTDEAAKIYGNAPATLISTAGQSGDLYNAIVSNISQGIPQKLVTVNQAIANLNKVIGK